MVDGRTWLTLWIFRALPAAPHFKFFPGSGVHVGSNVAVSSRWGTIGFAVEMPWKMFIIVELPVDSMREVIVGKDERFEFEGGFDRREDLAIVRKDAS